MSPRSVRRIVVVVCLGGVAGMIVASVAGSNGAALTFGLITATAVLCLMVATAVSGGATAALGGDERQAAGVEAMVERLVAHGADETDVRELVEQAVRLGRSSARRG
ncbi:MAG: hypothetical protein M3N68_06615 [Actinomycetota bacterium]|nr:hypothetical protein [Actinomycetota bacterium]